MTITSICRQFFLLLCSLVAAHESNESRLFHAVLRLSLNVSSLQLAATWELFQASLVPAIISISTTHPVTTATMTTVHFRLLVRQKTELQCKMWLF